MGKKKGGKSSGAVSKGERPNVSKWVRKDMRNSVAPIVTLQNKWKAFIRISINCCSENKKNS